MTLEINSPSNVDVMVWGCQRTIRNTFSQIIFIVSLIRHDVVYDHRTKMRLEGIKISNRILIFRYLCTFFTIIYFNVKLVQNNDNCKLF